MIVLDTHVLIWVVDGDARLGRAARAVIEESERTIDSVRLPGSFHADPADRFIVATARYCGTPLLTADGAILKYAAGGRVRVIDASR